MAQPHQDKNKITLYTCATPNGHKVSTVLEELGLQYDVRPVDLATNEQKEEYVSFQQCPTSPPPGNFIWYACSLPGCQRWFLHMNPNGRLPAITDGPFRVFESGAILVYLTQKYDTSHKISYSPDDLPGYTEQLSWLFWQHGGLGPMQGQAHHFSYAAPVRSDYGMERYTNETRRLYSVLEKRLQESPFLAGDKFTIADIASVFWVRVATKLLEWDLGKEGWPAIQKWMDGILQREAVQRAMGVPERKGMTEEEFVHMFQEKGRKIMEMKNSDLH